MTTITPAQAAALRRLEDLGFMAGVMGRVGPMQIDVMTHRETGLCVLFARHDQGFELYIQSTIRNSLAATWTALEKAIAAARSAQAPNPSGDVREATQILRKAGWPDATSVWMEYPFGDDSLKGYIICFSSADDDDVAIGKQTIWRPSLWRVSAAPEEEVEIESRNGRTLTESAKVLVRDAVLHAYAPNMEAARELIAQWDSE